MGLVAASLQSSLGSIFMKMNPDPITVGMQVANSYMQYLMQGMNAGGGNVLVVPQTPSAGQDIGKTFKSYLSNVAVASQLCNAFTKMASSTQSLFQASIVVVPAPLLPKLIKLFLDYPRTSKMFSDGLGDALDQWTKTFIVSGTAPGPSPFSGPLS
jgi:hypothetical protein